MAGQPGQPQNSFGWPSSFLACLGPLGSLTPGYIYYGIQSDLVTVDSGVPQGTVLGPILFLLHINDLSSVISSKVRLFADDCLVYREIKNRQDQIDLQKDLNLLENWGSK